MTPFKKTVADKKADTSRAIRNIPGFWKSYAKSAAGRRNSKKPLFKAMEAAVNG